MWQETILVTFLLFLLIAIACRPKRKVKEKILSRFEFEEATALTNRLEEIYKKNGIDTKALNRCLVKKYREEMYNGQNSKD